ncbi:MAG: DegV family protein [Clostridia bacterium]|nr:DegV family protein [Clostridia bacterium]
MAKTAVVTDSNSGITQAEAKELGVFVVPMPFLVNGEQFYEDVSLTQEGFYEKLTSDAEVSTSQPIVGELLEFWDNILKEYDDMVYIPMSSGLSEACNTAKMLAADYNGRVQVVDNQRISITMKSSVLDAKLLLERGMSAAEVKKYLEDTKMDSSIYISIPCLKYLKKGGRITPAAAAVGSMLHLRPVLQIQGERLDKFRMSTVTMKQAKAAMVEGIRADLNGRFKELVDKGEMIISVAHTQNREKALEFKAELENEFGLPVCWCDPLSLSVSCHSGPGSLAVACMRIVK